MGRFPSGQREQTVNLPTLSTMVRIHLCPPNRPKLILGLFLLQSKKRTAPAFGRSSGFPIGKCLYTSLSTKTSTICACFFMQRCLPLRFTQQYIRYAHIPTIYCDVHARRLAVRRIHLAHQIRTLTIVYVLILLGRATDKNRSCVRGAASGFPIGKSLYTSLPTK